MGSIFSLLSLVFVSPSPLGITIIIDTANIFIDVTFPFNLRVASALAILDMTPTPQVVQNILQFLNIHESNTIVYFRVVERLKTLSANNPSILRYANIYYSRIVHVNNNNI